MSYANYGRTSPPHDSELPLASKKWIIVGRIILAIMVVLFLIDMALGP